jgi:hypothetical protein
MDILAFCIKILAFFKKHFLCKNTSWNKLQQDYAFYRKYQVKIFRWTTQKIQRSKPSDHGNIAGTNFAAIAPDQRGPGLGHHQGG